MPDLCSAFAFVSKDIVKGLLLAEWHELRFCVVR